MQKIIKKKEAFCRIAYANSTGYKAISDGLFPPPVSIGARAVGWVEAEVAQVVAARIAGKSEDEIKTLVANLVKTRSQMPVIA